MSASPVHAGTQNKTVWDLPCSTTASISPPAGASLSQGLGGRWPEGPQCQWLTSLWKSSWAAMGWGVFAPHGSKKWLFAPCCMTMKGSCHFLLPHIFLGLTLHILDSPHGFPSDAAVLLHSVVEASSVLLCCTDTALVLHTEGLWQPVLLSRVFYWCSSSNSIDSLFISGSQVGNSQYFRLFHYYYICHGDG